MQRITIQHLPLQSQFHHNKADKPKPQTSFLQHLEQATAKQELKISKHANERIAERRIVISDQEWDVVTNKVFEAKAKGVKQPLVIMDQAALVVSAKNATVITAMDRKEAKEQLFTNIDGTIVL